MMKRLRMQLVQHRHQIILHAGRMLVTRWRPLLPEALQQCLGQVALISKYLPLHSSSQGLKRFAGSSAYQR